MSTDPAALRANLGHPVVDADGHCIEYLPAVHDLLRDLGGPAAVDGLRLLEDGATLTRDLTHDQRRVLGAFRLPWWGLPTEQTLDRATAMLPGLQHERLPALGIDVAVVYPTYGLMVSGIDDPDVRVPAALACNRYLAEAYGPFADRLLPVAIVPMHTVGEALDVLDDAVRTLGLRAVMLGGLVHRPLPGAEGVRAARWVDTVGLDSAEDYDPLWRRCVELGVSPTFHSTGMGWGSRAHLTSYCANHIGNFAAAGEALARSLFFGGAVHRFPELRWAFLEGGVAWAASLRADLVGHWEKRNRDAVRRYDPARLDRRALRDAFERYATPAVRSRLDALDTSLHVLSEPDEDPAGLDEWAAAGIDEPADVLVAFDRFAFGCEADDPLNALAFDARIAPPDAPPLRAMFASDLGHWDVPDARAVLPEAHELRDRGLLDAAELRAFTFDHAVTLWTATNPRFFAGTAIEAEVEAFLARDVSRGR